MASLSYRLFSKWFSYLPDRLKIYLLFLRRFRYIPSLENPRTFNEKIQFRKIYQRHDFLTIAAGKLESKKLVEDISPELYIPKTIRVLSGGGEVDRLDYDSLPDDYVIKANHTSQTLLFVRNGNHVKKEVLKKCMHKWLIKDQSSSLGEWAYKNVSRVVFIEEYLDFDGRVPDDYKFFVYHGEVKFIQVDYDRFSGHKRNMYDKDWNYIDIEYSHKNKKPIPSKPCFLNKMIEISENIGQHFDFIRVDLYFYNGRVAFGELTVYPGAGYEKFPDISWDIEFGRYWNVSKNEI